MQDILSIKEKQKLIIEIESIKNEPDSRKISAILWRLLLIEYTKYEKRVFKKGSRVELCKLFCDSRNISLSTFYRKRSAYKRKGIRGLILKYGKNKLSKIKNSEKEYYEIRYEFDLKNPLNSLQNIINSVLDSKLLHESKKAPLKILHNFIDTIKNIPGTNRALHIKRELTAEEKIMLDELKMSANKIIAKKAIVVSLLLNDVSLIDIIQESGKSMSTIYRWKRSIEEEGVRFISIKQRDEYTNKGREERKNRVARIIHYQPTHYGINRSSWSLQALADAYRLEYQLRIGKHAISRAIKEMGYTFKKARKVLTSEDPHYREKVDAIKKVKNTLDENVSFYFIDEAGPWAVKKYGGKSLHAPNEIKTYPQYQKKKGSITFIGAYEATKKIIIWKFVDQKNTDAVIEILKMIISITLHKDNVYVTWDSASWHDSKSLKTFIEEQNRICKPRIKVLPLPSKAQYLNTIESYFSGMKKAIIHNSDYQNREEMIAAIERYFREKNLKNITNYFKTKNKDEETDFESGLHKKIN